MLYRNVGQDRSKVGHETGTVIDQLIRGYFVAANITLCRDTLSAFTITPSSTVTHAVKRSNASPRKPAGAVTSTESNVLTRHRRLTNALTNT